MFYLIEITSYMDKDTVDKGIYSYTDRTLAIANFHSKMGGAMKKENFKTEMLMVVDSRGGVQTYDYWEREIEPEEAEVPEKEVEE